ncbi:Metalloprotease [Trametes versicolor FP-101664 SS1]|uniref:Metalloprotease n=1 Tax=Trametes versicolor (strain FP-101664) TaxID=717944 RepID=UPI00046238F6|nr:Metalloprotease [Trametes versicolor FP-101664 SS1]EIW62196.1 Metalloprotease [Trametes versicolor FP-101664 SS1]
MFSLAFITLAVSAALSLATPAKRAPALEVSLTAPANVNSIDDIKVTAAVTNTGSEDLKVLKYGTVLDSEIPTRSFTVSRDGVTADFTGVKLQLDIDSLDDSAFTVIPAGETILVEHQVASLYNFEKLGAGAFEFEPVTTFQVIEADAEPRAFKVAAQKVKVNVEQDVAKREIAVAHEKRARVSCSDSSRNSFIASSFSEGRSLASIASSYVSSNGADTLFRSYFGTTSTSTVRSVLSAVANENSSSRTLNCVDPYGYCTSGVIAYTLTATTNVYFCSLFFQEVPNSRLCSGTTVASRNIRGGTVLHELTHALSGTDDVGYGCSFDRNLGQTSPRQAAINADNYNCFATQVYQNTQC